MAFSAYSATPSSNTVIAGVNIAEGCSPANLNDAVRQLMADGKTLADAIPSTSAFVLKTGDTVGTLIHQNEGAGPNGGHLFHAGAPQVSGAVFFQPAGTALPASPIEGFIVFDYS